MAENNITSPGTLGPLTFRKARTMRRRHTARTFATVLALGAAPWAAYATDLTSSRMTEQLYKATDAARSILAARTSRARPGRAGVQEGPPHEHQSLRRRPFRCQPLRVATLAAPASTASTSSAPASTARGSLVLACCVPPHHRKSTASRPEEAPSFAASDLSGAKLFGRFSGGNLPAPTCAALRSRPSAPQASSKSSGTPSSSAPT